MLASKLNEIIRIAHERQPNWPHLRGWPLAPQAHIEQFLFDGDWSEGEKHDQWLEAAPAAEIAAWFLQGYEPDLYEEVA